MNKYKEIMIILIIIIIISTCILLFINIKIASDYCINQGYDTNYNIFNDENVEPGYVKCCNDIYVNHIETQQCSYINNDNSLNSITSKGLFLVIISIIFIISFMLFITDDDDLIENQYY